MEKLIKVQSELKVPKSQYNLFGKYNYRNAEDILEAVKPLLLEYNLLMKISDSIKEVGGRVYVCATVTISDGEKIESVEAYAREPETQKGMNDSQITGAASSYARKYALNGMFCIDDTKDTDGLPPDNNSTPKKEEPKKTPASTDITWLTDEQYKKTLDGTIEQIQNTINKYSTATHKMKKDYKETLQSIINVK